MSLKVAATGMPRPFAEELIHRLAEQGRWEWAPGFRRKLLGREFNMRQVMETLKGGSINQGPKLDVYGGWRCRVKRRVAGQLVRVVVAIENEEVLILISVH